MRLYKFPVLRAINGFYTDMLCELFHDVNLDNNNHVLAAAGPVA
jgi:hypothetical protein